VTPTPRLPATGAGTTGPDTGSWLLGALAAMVAVGGSAGIALRRRR
jgi:LPXTG-motif cell wall-anchored protein